MLKEKKQKTGQLLTPPTHLNGKFRSFFFFFESFPYAVLD